MNKEQTTQEIINYLAKKDGPAKLGELAKNFEFQSDSDEYQSFKKILAELVEQGVLEKSTRRRYSLKEDMFSTNIAGTLKISGDKGYVETDKSETPEIVVKRRNFFTALDGDKVAVNLLASKRGKKPRGEVVKVLERNREKIVGTVDFDGHFYFLVPDEQKYDVDFLIPEAKLAGAKNGDKVSAKLLSWTNPSKSPVVEVVGVIGKSGDISVEFQSVMKEFSLPDAFPEKVLKKARKIEHPEKIPQGRLDLRESAIITIDPADARDFDDALSLETLDNGNHRLGVHIADVAHFVAESEAIDMEARERGTSVYLVDRVVPMLPENLSNDICSLKPHEDRLAYSVFIEITKRGVPKDYKIVESVINSKRRFTYEEVLDIIKTKKGDYSTLILGLDKLAKTLRKRRFRKGGVDFQTSEVKFKLDDKKNPVDVKLKSMTDATSLVEECMLIANQTVAGCVKELSKPLGGRKRLPFLYRVHETPDPKIMKDTLRFLSSFVPDISTSEISSKEINDILQSVKGKPGKFIVDNVLIRSMPKAIYSTNNIGHYGLGFEHYSHFTSPIRRYPDLIVHRLLKEYLKGNFKNDRLDFLSMILKDVAKHSSLQERVAMESERATVKIAHCAMAKKHIGEVFDGTISGVTNFGLFVYMDGIYSEGLLHIKDLEDDYYYFEQKLYRLVGKRRKKVFNIGKRIRVKIIDSKVKSRRIELNFVKEIDS